MIFAPSLDFQCYDGFVDCFIDLVDCCVHNIPSAVIGWKVLWSGEREVGGDGMCDLQEAWRGELDDALLKP